MVYVIMCGGKYPHFARHKALTMINGEPLIARTIRILKELTDDQIFITADDEAFSEYGVVLPHENSYRHDGIQGSGYWLDAFYPHFLDGMEVTFLMGDVCFTEEALKTIVEYKAEKNTLFGTSIANNSLHFDWGEAFAYKVVDYKEFMDGVEAVKKLQDEGKTNRIALVWELYRYLNGFDVNIQRINPETYVGIDDGTMDVDMPGDEKYVLR